VLKTLRLVHEFAQKRKILHLKNHLIGYREGKGKRWPIGMGRIGKHLQKKLQPGFYNDRFALTPYIKAENAPSRGDAVDRDELYK
jgi:lactate dehydrogenase-like 2-hydroxyacid dehydrogenase